MDKKIVGHIAAALTILMWSATYTSTKILLADFSHIEVTFYRSIIAYIALWLLRPKPLPFKSFKQELPFIGMGFFGLFLYYICQNSALEYTTATNVSVIVTTAPIFTALCAQIFMKEKHLTAPFMVGSALALGGVVLITQGGRLNLNISPQGDILALLSAISWAGYSTFLGLTKDRDIHPVIFARRTYFWGLVFLIPSLPFYKFNFGFERFGDSSILFHILFLGLGASAIAYLTWNFASKRIGVVTTSLYIYSDSVFAVALAVIVLKEKLTLITVLGIALVLGGVILAGLKKKNESDKIKELKST